MKNTMMALGAKHGWFLAVLLSLSTAVLAQSPLDSMNLPDAHQQVLFVQADSWSSTAAKLQRYERNEMGWIPVGEPFPVMVGRTGLAWGRGLHAEMSSGPQKREGDGKAPAGIFLLGDAFGYGPKPPAACGLPYRAITERDYFVDDAASSDYNNWVTIPTEMSNEPASRWASFERMQRPDHQYKLGVVVAHNTYPVQAGAGSAIFLHIWRKSGSPTAGCTAMDEADLLTLLSWLDPAKKPLLVQGVKGIEMHFE